MGFVGWFALATPAAIAASNYSPEQIEFFEARIRPLLVEHCYKCHSVARGKSKGGLQLDTRDGLQRGGGSGPALVPGEPEKSLLIEAVRYATEDLQMPPADEGGKLAQEDILLLEQWVKMGAPDPRDGGPPHPLDMAAARRHWAFQPVAKPAVPPPGAGLAGETPVDAFVRAQRELRQLPSAAPADARTLLRRVTYDLTGLPPTPAETAAFVREYPQNPDAYPRVVERLLASPAYGERWGRFWLDVARYADTQGYLVGNAERRFAFAHTYRDYVIRAFNDDKPFDQFIIEQLAADRLPLGEDKAPLAALGFLTLGRRFLGNQNDIIDDRIDVVTRGLMGLTVTCARCHDHKFDPVPSHDYYALHGVFASSEEPAEKPLLVPLVDSPAYQTYLRKQAEVEAKIKARERAEVEKFLAGLRGKVGDYLLGAHDAARLKPAQKFELFAGTRKLNPAVLKRWQAFLAERADAPGPILAPWFAFAALPDQEFASQAGKVVADLSRDGAEGCRPIVEALRARKEPIATLKDVAAVYNQVCARVEKAWQAAQTKEGGKPAPAPTGLARAEDEAIRQFLRAEGAPANLAYEAAATMIRRELGTKTAALRREREALNWTEPGAPLRAMALVDKDRPRNSRVLLRGNPAQPGPEVPRQFLEILAGESRVPFADGSGRLELARAIASAANPLTARVFVNRVWGWHFGAALVPTPSDFGVRTAAPVQQALLDWLAASFVEAGWSVKALQRMIVLSQTYRQASDAPPAVVAADPDNLYLTRGQRRRLEFEALRDTVLAVSGQLDKREGGVPDDLTQEPFARRRTVYGFIDRQNLPGMFRTFDYPNPDVSSAQRFSTTVPQQALFLMNSPFVLQAARQLAARVTGEAGAGEPQAIERLFQLVYQRAPEPEEAASAVAFLRSAAASPPKLEPPEVQSEATEAKPAGRKAVRVPSPPLSRAEALAQVLLLSNELAFVD